MSYVNEVLSQHVERLKQEEESLKESILFEEARLKEKHIQYSELRDKRSELERFIKQ